MDTYFPMMSGVCETRCIIKVMRVFRLGVAHQFQVRFIAFAMLLPGCDIARLFLNSGITLYLTDPLLIGEFDHL